MARVVERFSAIVHTLGINPCVDVPDNVVSALLRAAGKTRGPIPVCGTVNKTPITATVVKYDGAWRLYLNTEMRRAARIPPGDRVRICLRFDPATRRLPVPRELRRALAKNARARKKWDTLAPSHRREYLAYLNSLKTAESLERNVKRVIRSLPDK